MAEAVQQSSRDRAEKLLGSMNIEQKIGQLVQVEGSYGTISDALRAQVAEGRVGSVINEVDPATVQQLQTLARDESPHGIPLLIGRDVIHGFKTVFPIPLGMAASWNEPLVEKSARIAAWEAAQQGVNWTFSPMLDVSRDPRWGRIAESFGEDTWLTGRMGAAMVRGYQNGSPDQLIACLKHFVGYGACEAGKDYNTTNIPEIELHNTYLPPFEAGVRAGAWTVMPSFSDLNGMPPSGNAWLLREVLRDGWGFDGLVISDWASVAQLIVHGVAEDEADAARQSALAGVTMDMVSGAYASHLEALVSTGALDLDVIDQLVLEVLRVKFAAGLFDQPQRSYVQTPDSADAIATALELAEQSLVLLQNRNDLLPLRDDLGPVSLLGPLADQADEQLGTWVFDGDVSRSRSLKDALSEELGNRLQFDEVLSTSRDRDQSNFAAAIASSQASDVTILALGEEAILSGEAHCRVDIGLPGAQRELLAALSAADKPLVVIVMAGRPLVIPEVLDAADAVIYAWHAGSMAGPAIRNLLFGRSTPSGKLPVSLPRHAGQVPIYYNHGNTGKPATPETVVHIDDIDAKAPQTSVGNTSFHLDVDPSPLFPFGFGLSFTEFAYDQLAVSASDFGIDVAVRVTNVGEVAGTEVAQLYVRDLVASATRPVRELKGYQRLPLQAGEAGTVTFRLTREDLSFHNGRERVFEPGRFQLWVGGDSTASLSAEVTFK